MRSGPRLGRKQTKNSTRRCPVCGEVKPVREFIKRGKRIVNLYCNHCRLHDKEAVRKFLQRGLPFHKTRRREAFIYLLALARRRFAKREGMLMAEAEKYAVRLAKLPDRIAAIVGKTYAVMGDEFKLADDEALMRVRDLLEEIDDTLIKRNKDKKLSRG